MKISFSFCLLPLCFFVHGIPCAFAQENFNPVPSSIDSPGDDPAIVLKRLSTDSEGKTPTQKNFDPAWIQSLGQRGEATVYTKENSKNFSTIGVPVGGIGAGELYLSGDGKLWLWDIFNTLTVDNFQIEQGHAYIEPHTPGKPDHFSNVLSQGFVLQTTSGDKTDTRSIDKDGFSDVKFRGQYPICYVDYADPACPVQVSLEAFSPFVPGSVADSSYPATTLHYTLTNTSNQPVDCVIGGWLENGASWGTRHDTPVQLQNTVVKGNGYTALNCSSSPPSGGPQPPDVFEDFESGTYNNWTVEGTAFGSAPAQMGVLPRSKTISPDCQGQYYVDSYLNNSNDAQGKLTSKPFEIKRPYITFLVGGGGAGSHQGIHLLVDGAPVRQAAGRGTRKLRREFWDVHDLIGKTAQIEIVDEGSGGWAFTQADDICFADTPLQVAEEPDFGTMTLALLGDPATTDGVADVGIQKPSDAVLSSNPTGSAQMDASAKNPQLVGGLRHKVTLQPGEKVTLNYIVSWYFPNPTGLPVSPGRRAYAARFKSSEDLVAHLAQDSDRLTAATRLWHDTYYDSTLPYWFLNRTFLNVSTLASSTAFLLDDNLFYANEGGYSCPGTCTHVWSYQAAMDDLFPELEKGLDENVSFKIDNDGGMAPDGGIQLRQQTGGQPAVDGQAGVILRAALADRMSADHSFVTKNYDSIKRAMNYLIDHNDADHDGIMEGAQANTLDSAWYGKVAWLSLYYQAALRATAAMADIVKDTEYAGKLRAMADQGRQYIEQNLFDGDYFVEKVEDPKHLDSPGSYTGCEIDQLMGQAWAYQAGLGEIIDPVKATTAINSIWKYNYTTDVGPYRQAFPKGRWFALAGEGGLVMGSFPKGTVDNALNKGYGAYFNETWAGSEHLFAALMMWQGQVDKALAEERTIDDRYAVTKRNPWDEVECGSHYARSMASYSVFTAACGYEYNGPEGALAFAPRLTPDNFKAAFTAAEGWGSYSQKYEGSALHAMVDLRYGKLSLTTLALVPPAGNSGTNATVSLDGKAVPAQSELVKGRLLVHFSAPVLLAAGQKLRVESR
jgi:non-lysosomal glucosylceramidase